MRARKSDFAGSWYPGDERGCLEAIEGFIQNGSPCPSPGTEKFGGIVPHAGWYFSGRLACNVINCLTNRSTPDTIVVFGRHLHP
jgi:AmmeMemoRadiSam system protein B